MERLEQYTKGLHLATKHKAALLRARFAWCSPDVAWCSPDVSSVLYSYVCLSGIAALWPVPQCQRFISCCSGSIFTTLLSRLVIPWISFESNTPFHKQANFFFYRQNKTRDGLDPQFWLYVGPQKVPFNCSHASITDSTFSSIVQSDLYGQALTVHKGVSFRGQPHSNLNVIQSSQIVDSQAMRILHNANIPLCRRWPPDQLMSSKSWVPTWWHHKCSITLMV
jgi:hypothetical protein